MPIDIEEGLNILREGITRQQMIVEGLPVKRYTAAESMNLYTTAYNLCLQKPPYKTPRQVYDVYKKSFEDYVLSTVLPDLREKHDEVLLRQLVRRMETLKILIKGLSHFFGSLDRYFLPLSSLPRLEKTALNCFRELALKEINGKVMDAVIARIHQEREGEQIDQALLKTVLQIYVQIGMDCYEKDFEAAMLRDTSSYYCQKSSNWILEDSFPDYMLKAEECLKREKQRIAHYLHSSSERKLLAKVRHEVLSVHANQLLENGKSLCRALLRDNKVDDLSRMFRLLSKMHGGVDHVSRIFEQHVITEVMALVKVAEGAASNKEEAEERDTVCLQEQIVWKVIELHDKYLPYVSKCFQNITLFHEALKEAFVVFCNNDVAGSSSAQLLATFCDYILRKDQSEELSDEAIEETLEKVVKLLGYINDKDLFAEFYRKKLAQRLLFDKTAIDDHERSILMKLMRHGRQFTSSIEGMFTDFILAKENQPVFEEYLRDNPNVDPGIDLTVTILTSCYWPHYKSLDLNLPAEMTKCVGVFKDFYQTKTKFRKLRWIYSLGTCVINGKFEPKTMELIVTTSQACALFLFNSSDRLSYSEIKTQLMLSDDDDVTRVLHSLSCAKYKILNKEPNTNSISPTDYFEFNSKFTDKMSRIQIPLPHVDENKKVIEDVEEERRYIIDAKIIQIMRSQQSLGYQNLLTKCVQLLSCRFKPDVKTIEKRIDNLIFRDFLARSKDDAELLVYLA